ncbi:Stk1 family PASTA domain-containing Ser/Thr kinase [Streptoalloteichus hindustanus]|uniref:non-specific serine/threonine protein kinase n=1 Tax=Streptoalloteichus hindustanus TaxID=2017 RepID=A0A1M4V5Y2_STRHI|nr:Stk1 family PASTA domain-containing Ser/Thr kinase [Streptoalloteichus hindustanus]SHE64396.1 serine/threonine protein kinase [Streptoalloteichus hindustanus]
MTTPRLLSNRYELGDTLGYGGMSEVHRGRDVRLGRDVAVKVLRADLARDPQFQLRFRREAQNAAALNHPAIVAVYDTGETETEYGPLPYIVMEFVDGRTLRDMIKSEGPLPPRRAMEIMADVCAALDFSHRHGIVHRDVKPANIMITRSGAVKVMDFGIARALADGQAAVTQTAAVIGTAQYLSPEQARGETVDARSDVYATGCVLFELLTGEPPFTGDSPVAVAYQHVREDPRTPSDVNPQVPTVLDAVVLKAMSKNPANRYQSAAEMRADLVRVLSGQRPSAPAVMSEEERTTMLGGGGGATEVMGGRHRPNALADSAADQADEQAARRRKTTMVALVTALCVAVLAIAAWVTTSLLGNNEAPKQEKIALPNVVNVELVQARNQLTAKGFTNVQEKTAPSSAEQRGMVTSMNPPAETQVGKNDPIVLTVGSGPERTKVPDLSGKTQEQARQLLADQGLQLALDVDQEETDNSALVGKVVKQSPAVGAEVDKNSRVSITVGKALDQVQVPPLTDMTLDNARSVLDSLGLTASTSNVASDKDAGTVVGQSPAKGTRVKKGTSVTLQVSDGSQKNKIQMPKLDGMTPDQAKQKLNQLGWNGSLDATETPTDKQSEDGKILNQSPNPGEKIDPNQRIRVAVGKYKSGGHNGTTTTTTPPGGGFLGR